MASAERDPITVSGSGAPSWVQGQSPWSGNQGRNPLKLKAFELFIVQCSVLFCSLAILDPRVGHTVDVLYFSIYLWFPSF